MTRAREFPTFAALAAAGSAAMLGGALFFQYVMGLAPCAMCIWQRWPHGLAVALGVLIVALPFLRRAAWARLLGAALMLTGAGIALYHTGVERLWWQGPTTCTSSGQAGLSTDDLLQQILEAPVVRCDEVAWEFLSLSMASWNGIASLALAGLWLISVRRG